MARYAVVDLRDEFSDGHVQCGEREELPVAQLRNDEASRDLNCDFNLGFVARTIRPRWDNGSVVVGRHLGVGAVDRWLVEAGLGDASAQIVGHHHRRNPAEEGKGAGVRADQVG
jgi:hypothetical protein